LFSFWFPLPFGGVGGGHLHAQTLTERYSKQRPVVIVCDWDKAPYEFLDDEGEPAGSNVDVLKRILGDMKLPYQFVMKEWSNAIKTFERGDADLILANVNRFKGDEFYITQIINYNRIRVAMTRDTTDIVSLKTLEQEGVVLKTGDYTSMYFKDTDPEMLQRIEYQTPKMALTSLLAGDNKYFVWGEEPLKWKIRTLHLDGIYLNEVGIPVSEVHMIGRDRELIDEIDDRYSRLKQSGELEVMLDKWLHPEHPHTTSSPLAIYIILGALLLAGIIFLFYRLAKAHVKSATRRSTMLNEMMDRAMQMGDFKIMEYDIAHDRFTNRRGSTTLPEQGMTLEEFTHRIHPNQRQEFAEKMQLLMSGRERRFDLNKQWNAGTDENPHWLIFQGHAISELDKDGHPAYIVNAIHDITHDVEADIAERALVHKYEQLTNMPLVASSFYDKDGWFIEMNDQMRQICGISSNDNESQRYWENFRMFDIPLFKGAYAPNDRQDLHVCQHMLYDNLGIDKYIEYCIHPLIDEHDNLVNYLCSCVDVTDERNRITAIQQLKRKVEQTALKAAAHRERFEFLSKNCPRNEDTQQARDRLNHLTALAKESVQLKNGFLASMTHELRTPLNAILGFASILDSLEQSEERAEYVRIIRNSSDMLQRLINDIIEASVLSEGPTSIRPEPVDFVKAFDDICLTLQQRIHQSALAHPTEAKRDVTFLTENPYNTFLTTIDIGRIQQVLTNFVTNAVKFTEKGHIRLGYRYENHGLYLYCEDTGKGIPLDKQQTVFERFVKLDEFIQGTGMGLAICKSIAERCEGEIGVISQGEGTGSTFWFWIPCERRLS